MSFFNRKEEFSLYNRFCEHSLLNYRYSIGQLIGNEHVHRRNIPEKVKLISNKSKWKSTSLRSRSRQFNSYVRPAHSSIVSFAKPNQSCQNSSQKETVFYFDIVDRCHICFCHTLQFSQSILNDWPSLCSIFLF